MENPCHERCEKGYHRHPERVLSGMEKDLLNPKKIAEKRRMDIGETFFAEIHPAPQSPSRLATLEPNAVIIRNDGKKGVAASDSRFTPDG